LCFILISSGHLLIRCIYQDKGTEKRRQRIHLFLESKLSGRSGIKHNISLYPSLCVNEGFLRGLAQCISIIFPCDPANQSHSRHLSWLISSSVPLLLRYRFDILGFRPGSENEIWDEKEMFRGESAKVTHRTSRMPLCLLLIQWVQKGGNT
jgi:hypothetical protein